MRRHLAALLLASSAVGLPLPASAPAGPAAAPAQEPPTLRLAASPQLTRQMEDAPGDLAWSDLPAQLEVEFVASDALPMDRVPIRLVAVAVLDGEIVGQASTTPTVATAGESLSASRIAGRGWPPAEEWFPAPLWRPDGIGSPNAPIAPVPEAAASQITLPSNAGGVMLFAAPAADPLVDRFRTLPVVVTTWRTGDTTGTDTTGADTTTSRIPGSG